MRRTDDQTILQMRAEGRTGIEIAKHFGVSPAYICKRLKQLQSVEEPESFARLSEKQKKFVLAKVEGKSNTEAALMAFDVTSRDSAKALGHTTMKDPDVGRAIQEIMAEEGLTRRHIIRKLKGLVDHPDGHISAKGIDMTSKLMDLFPQVKQERPAPQIFISDAKFQVLIESLNSIRLPDNPAAEKEAKELARSLLADLREEVVGASEGGVNGNEETEKGKGN